MPHRAYWVCNDGAVTVFARFLLVPLLHLFFRPTIVGRKNLPKRGGILIASNHLTFIDSCVITLVAIRPVRFMVKDDYFDRPGLKGWIIKTFFKSIGAVPVRRGAGHAAQDALDQGLEVLRDGDAFSIYPEGTRSRDGRLYKGRTGVAWLALNAGVPIVPVAVAGTDIIQPDGGSKFVIKRRVIRVEFGAPIDVSGFGPANSGRARRDVTDAVMREIAAMSGQELAGVLNDGPVEESAPATNTTTQTRTNA